MQVDPIEPKLKARGTMCLKLEYDGLFSNFAFKLNLHRYTKGNEGDAEVRVFVTAGVQADVGPRMKNRGTHPHRETPQVAAAATQCWVEAEDTATQCRAGAHTRPLFSSR